MVTQEQVAQNMTKAFETWKDCIICISFWTEGAFFRDDTNYLAYLYMMFDVDQWQNIQHVCLTYPYVNPFNHDYTKQHYFAQVCL